VVRRPICTRMVACKNRPQRHPDPAISAFQLLVSKRLRSTAVDLPGTQKKYRFAGSESLCSCRSFQVRGIGRRLYTHFPGFSFVESFEFLCFAFILMLRSESDAPFCLISKQLLCALPNCICVCYCNYFGPSCRP